MNMIKNSIMNQEISNVGIQGTEYIRGQYAP